MTAWNFRNRAAMLALAVGAAVLPTRPVNAECGGFGWLPGEGVPGVHGDANRSVNAAIEWDDGTGSALYVAGEFTVAGSVPALNIAKWDGQRWSAVGGGLSGVVNALTIWNGQLIAAGRVNSSPGSQVMRWNGSAWEQIGFMGPSGNYVKALTVHDGKLVIGGFFGVVNPQPTQINRVAWWDGELWQPFAGGLTYMEVSALTEFNGDLVAAGDFSAWNHVARWDGRQWQMMGQGFSNRVEALLVHNGQLYAGGWFVGRIAQWDGAQWNTVGGGVNTTVWTLASLGDLLVAGGQFSTAGGVGVNFVAGWDGMDWQPLGSGHAGSVRVLALFGGELVTLRGTIEGSVGPLGAWRWDGGAWHPIGAGFNGSITAATSHKDEVIVGGRFTVSGGAIVNRVSRFDGRNWQPMGSGMNGDVDALTIYNGDPIAGGAFTLASDQAANRIARWDGRQWQPLGDGMNNRVYALTVHDDKLIAGGQFNNAGGVAANHVAQWDGSQWSPIGTGIGGSTTAVSVRALSVYQGALVAGSNRGPTASPALGVARWSGSQWVTIGGISGLSADVVYALREYSGELIAGGDFGALGGVSSPDLVALNGSQWHALGSSSGWQAAYALGEFDGDLIVGGGFAFAGSVGTLRRWDGSQWSSLGSGTGGHVFTLTVQGEQLVVGGDFQTAGGNISPYLARWACIYQTSDLDGSGHVNGIDLALLLSQWGACSALCPADINQDGVVNGVDLALLLSHWG